MVPVTAPWSMTTLSAHRATEAKPCTVWYWNSCLGVKWMPAWRARLTTCKEMIESPPSSKKLSVSPTLSSFNTPAQTAAISRSSSVRGSRYSTWNRLISGCGSALRSSLPFGVSGSASRNTNCAGTMYSGRVCLSWPRSASRSADCRARVAITVSSAGTT
ncbi:hypothetical protein D3C79_587770 [compost metagenome]